MMNYKKTQRKAEKVFKELGIEFLMEDFNKSDKDLNYLIHITTMGGLKPLNYIKALIYFNFSVFSMNLLIANIYKIEESENINELYSIINKINLNISSGSFGIFEYDECGNHKLSQIIYKSSINCGDDFSDLDKDLVASQLTAFINALPQLFDLMDERYKTNERYEINER